jgi:outer membrane receptor protein involved in Fe transport
LRVEHATSINLGDLMSRRSNDSRLPFARVPARTLVAAAVAAALASSYSAVIEAQEAAPAGQELAEITVTGSRIVRRDLEAASPVVTVENKAFQESSTIAVESVLNQLPQYVPTNQTQFATSDVFPSATSTPGVSSISLRGLGANRTLVLIDGRRAQPVNSTLIIDTNSIPAAALESVEIITGGASAVYGADALAGVTNFKLRSNFEGIEFTGRSGITEEGDGAEHSLSMLLGSSLADGRGNAMLGVEWSKRQEVLAKDRDYWTAGLKDSRTNSTSVARMNRFQYEPGGNPGSPSQAAANAAFGNPAGYNVPRTSSFLFNDDFSLFKLENRGLGFKGDLVNDPRYKIAPTNQLIENNFDLRYSSPLERYSLFGKADFKITDRVTAFSQVNFVNTWNMQVLQPSGAVGGFGAAIPYGNDIYGPSVAADGSTLAQYRAGGSLGLNCPAMGGCTQSQAFPVPAQLAGLLNSRGANQTSNATTAVSYDPTTGAPVVITGADASWQLGGTLNFLPVRTIENNTNLYQILTGLRGDLGFSDWTWEAYGSHGATRVDLDYIGFASTRRFQQIVSAPNFGRNYSATGPGSASISCTSGLPIFENFQVSQDCIDAISSRYTDRTRLTQDIVEATAQGHVVDIPWGAGEVRGALGYTWRKNEFQYFPDATRETNSILDIPVGAFAQANVTGKTTAKEVFGELLVPLLKDVPGAKSLELELGYRYSDYDTAGKVPTWKALFSWGPVDFFHLRGGVQVANRAPNINELFLDSSSQAVTMRAADYCRADTTERSGNNPLNPNRAKAQALCSALIGNPGSAFDLDPNNYTGGRGDGVILQQSQGNETLKSEDGRTYTLGFVLTSPFDIAAIQGTTLSVDYYRAKITNAIAATTAQSTYDLCFNRDGVSNPNYLLDDPNGLCRNIQRDENTGAALQVLSQYQNLGLIKTDGLDVNLNWRAALEDIGLASLPGRVSANIAYTKLFSFKAQEFPTAPALENAGTLARGGLFDWRTVTTLRYTLPTWNVGLEWRHLPSAENSIYVTDPTTVVQGAGAYDMFGLKGEWNATDNIAISGGVDNLFNRKPEKIGAGQITNIAPTSGGVTTIADGVASNPLPGYYDVLGRRYFLQVKLAF